MRDIQSDEMNEQKQEPLRQRLAIIGNTLISLVILCLSILSVLLIL